MDDLLRYLIPSGVDEEELTKSVIPHLFLKGFKKIADLEDLEHTDLDGELNNPSIYTYIIPSIVRVGFNDLTKRRIWRFVHSVSKPSEFSVYTDVYQDEQRFVIDVHYILCSDNLFSENMVLTDIKDIDPTTFTLFDIIKCISEDAKLPPEQAIELYSSEGYPLQNNEITNKGMQVW